MKIVSSLALCLGLVLVLSTVTAAADAVIRTVNAPEDRVWAVAEAVLKHQGWEIEKADRAIGWITTKSRMLEGGDYGVYAKRFNAAGVAQGAEFSVKSYTTRPREPNANEPARLAAL